MVGGSLDMRGKRLPKVVTMVERTLEMETKESVDMYGCRLENGDEVMRIVYCYSEIKLCVRCMFC